MRVPLTVLFITSYVLADNHAERHSKLPFVADAVGNTLPPPSNVPATVGSPVNLLTPDRYEFYTFDESGELVKRLMTLEEIQAIVAAGEEAEGLVTFANDKQPTVAFNFSQPSYNKVHSVVTNVQNVLKAQMEAQKNKTESRPTLDTPDVSDTWSLILPSIFGNSGVDISPDKSSGSFTTPDTETIEIDYPQEFEHGNEILFSKEGSTQISSSRLPDQENKIIPVTEKMSSTNTNTAPEIPTTTPIARVTTMAAKTTTITTSKTTPTLTSTTFKSPFTITTIIASNASVPTSTKSPITPKITPTIVSTGASTTTKKPPKPTRVTVTRPQLDSTTINVVNRSTITTARPFLSTKHTSELKSTTNSLPKFTYEMTTTAKPNVSTTIRPFKIIGKKNTSEPDVATNNSNLMEKVDIQYEKVSTFKPISLTTYVTERITETSTKTNVPKSTVPTPLPTSTPFFKYPSSTVTDAIFTNSSDIVGLTEQIEKHISDFTPSFNVTKVSSPLTESSVINEPNFTNELNKDEVTNYPEDPILPLFDVAQSISQIASDLGNYQPVPTIASLLNATKLSDVDLESKENFDIDIPNDTMSDINSFIKISTSNPQKQNDTQTLVKEPEQKNGNKSNSLVTTTAHPLTTNLPKTTIDVILTESMGDLLSQVVNQAPQTIVENEKNSENEIKYKPTISGKNVTNLSLSSNDSKAIEKHIEMKVGMNVTSNSSLLVNIVNKELPTLVQNTNINENLNKKETNDTKNLQNETTNLQNLKSNIQTKSDFNLKNNKLKLNSTTVEKKNSSLNHAIREENSNLDSNLSLTKNVLSVNNTKNVHQTSSSSSVAIIKDNKTTDSVKIVNDHTNDVLNGNKTNDNKNFPKIDEFKKKIQKVNIDDKEFANERNNSWKLISTVSPPKGNSIPNDKLIKNNNQYNNDTDKDIILEFPKENQGLEVTTKEMGEDMLQFTELCNELAFRYWNTMIGNLDKKRSFVFSPYSITSMLAMMFMGARGATSGEMNEILKLDDMVTFNPHFTLKTISDSIETTPEAGVVVSTFIRELYSDRDKGKVLTFYKERAQQFYNGHVEEVNFKLISDIIRRRTNLLVKRYTWGKIIEYMKANTISMQPPLAAFSANIFQTDCTGSSVDGRDGEMYFVVSPNVRQRRLVPVPAVVYKKDFLAGYDPVLDATAAALGNTNSVVSTLFLMSGQQGNVVHAEDLEALEKRLLNSNPTTPTWNRILRTLLPRVGLELQIPRFSHKSVFNISSTLRKMGLKDIFDAEHADLAGLNGPTKDLYLSDMIQSSSFVTCGEGVIGEQHHIEEYPENLEVTRRRRTSRWADWDEPRDYQRAFHDPHDVGDAMHLPLHLRPRQARLPARDAQQIRLKFDRPFLYFVRHNPSGMILYVGRYNPRLLP